MREKITNLCRQFNIKGNLVEYKPISSGHINTTFQVAFDNNGKKEECVLQKINKYVFKNPKQVMENIEKVTNYILEDLKRNNVNANRRVLKFYNSKQGTPYVIDQEGEYWRVYEFVKDSVSYDLTSNLKVLEETGKAFGKFQSQLNDFPIEELNITIPNFHNPPARYITFKQLIEQDPYFRVNECQDEIETLLELEQLISQMTILSEQGKLKQRVVHNDTKCNNVLFDNKTKDYLCVIDLDTVMPGLIGYDYGDAIRFCCNSASEDEKDLSKVKLDFKKFEAFTKGFLSQVGNNLEQEEYQTLALGAVTITTELAMRFLSDYLCGDKYFKINYQKHNLDRARSQLALSKDMIKNLDKMKQIIEKNILQQQNETEKI